MTVLRRFLLLCALMPWTQAQAVPTIQHWTTDEGLKVYFVESNEIPMLDIRLVFDAGSARDSDEKAGLARMVSFMLGQSAGGKSADEMAAGFADVGAGFGASASSDSASLSLRSLTDQAFLEPAIALFLTAISQPDFTPQDLSRGQRQFLVALEAEKADPGSIAAKAFNKAIFGDHPYGRPGKGNEDSIAGLQRDDLRSFFQRYYVSRNGVLAMVGAIDRGKAERIAKDISAKFPAGQKAAPLPEVKSLQKPSEIRQAFPSKQAHVMIGAPGIRRDDPDRHALMLANHVLGGGGFTSRLVKQVRKERGYVYSIYSYFSPMAQRGAFMVGMQTRGSQVADAIDVARDELQKFLEDGATQEEFDAAKANITGSFPLRIAGNAQIVQNLSAIGFYGLPLDYLDTYISRIDAIELGEAMGAFRKHIDADNLVTLIVGGDD